MKPQRASLVDPVSSVSSHRAMFRLSLDDLLLTWRARAPAAPPVAPPVPGPSVRAWHVPSGGPLPIDIDAEAGPLLEQTDYVVFLQSRTRTAVGLQHRDPALLSSLQASDDATVLHGTLSFGSQVGTSRFVLTLGGRPVAAFEVEVYPTKLDYRTDFAHLRADLDRMARGLATSYLQATFLSHTADHPALPTPAEWAATLRAAMDRLEQALHAVAQAPLYQLDRTLAWERPGRIRRPAPLLVRHLRRHADTAPADGPIRLPARQAEPTLDTAEHRWLATALRDLRRRAARVIQTERRHPASRRQARIVEEIEALHDRLDGLTRLPVLAAATDSAPRPTLRLQTAPGYREAYQACLALRQGVSAGGSLEASLRDVHALYEAWCFLTLIRLLAARSVQPPALHTLVRPEADGLRMRLRTPTDALTFTLPRGMTVDLAYTPYLSGAAYLVPQQPDFLLTVRPPDAAPFQVVLDAKYRLDASPGYVRRYSIPGPPTDALNTLHRYRDAIAGGPGRPVRYAVALYPYRAASPEPYAASRHAQALADLGIGAVPLLPGATDHLEAWLNEILHSSASR